MEYHNEDLKMVRNRWAKLVDDFKDAKTGNFNISKIPDIFDCAKYDSLYNQVCGNVVKEKLKIKAPYFEIMIFYYSLQISNFKDIIRQS